jgi:SAM-dependent methyltransferase
MADHPQIQDARARLLSHFSAAKGTTEHGKKWNELYKQGFMPWDKGFPSPALVDLLSSPPASSSPSHPNILPQAQKVGAKKRALVPGCGKGYDVLLLAAYGYEAYGLDYSELALSEAKRIQAEKGGEEIYARKEGVLDGSVNWASGDFFGDEFLGQVEWDEGEERKFDLIYDYTVCFYFYLCFTGGWNGCGLG